MSSGTHMLSSKVRDTVFTKTARGRVEVTDRSAGLNGKQRSVLIMLDGRKSMRDIATLLPQDEIARIVEILLERELIAPWAEAVPSSAAPRMPAIAGIARSDSENHKDAAKLLRTKTLMTDSAVTYLGLMASDVVRRVQDASDEIELISVIGHWHMAMRESKYGRKFAAIHLEEIKTSLRGEA